jgi:hypothetical protein
LSADKFSVSVFVNPILTAFILSSDKFLPGVAHSDPHPLTFILSSDKFLPGFAYSDTHPLTFIMSSDKFLPGVAHSDPHPLTFIMSHIIIEPSHLTILLLGLPFWSSSTDIFAYYLANPSDYSWGMLVILVLIH